MMKRLWQATDGSEAELVPKPHRACISGCYEIELHGLVPKLPRDLLRMLAHCRGEAAAPGGRRNHVATVTDVVAWP